MALQLHGMLAITILVGAATILFTRAGAQALPNCQDECGDLAIPYPFGIGAGCYLREEFNITCNQTTAYLMKSNVIVTNISVDDAELQISQYTAADCYDSEGPTTGYRTLLRVPTPYTISNKNNFITVGCDTYSFFQGYRGDKKYTTGCLSICDDLGNFNESCSGVGCCQTSIPSGLRNQTVTLKSFYNHTRILDFNPCSYAFIVQDGEFTFNKTSYDKLSNTTRLPAVLDWRFENKTTCGYACMSSNSVCNESLGYICQCLPGYRGNPYLQRGCQGISVGFSVLLTGISSIYWGLKKRNSKKLKERNFKENGGLLLQEQLASHGGSVETLKIFTAEGLAQATNNYHESGILGEGGYGTVYKGVFPDKKVVAIKKSKISAQSQSDQFVNEVIVLSQINHRNVVKLLGCCLETEMPKLVYEFITNGTLYEHIHKKKSPLTLKLRMKIAVETVGALAYLHSSASTPIIHRDVKASNILLDENYMTKVSDFGASRMVALGETQIATLVLGTLGYLDPEYLQSNMLTEKSDVYSFGVVLVELLTRKVPLSKDGRCLASVFVSCMAEDCLAQILDNEIANDEGSIEILKQVASLAGRCLRVKGEERPFMKEVATELEGMRVAANDPLGKNNVGFNSEETECLLGSPADSGAYVVNVRGEGEGDGRGDLSIGTSIGYESMQVQMLMPYDDGR